MNIRSFIKKLRFTADSLEELFVDKSNETEHVAKKILRKKKHWSQTAEGKKHMSKLVKARWAAKRKAEQ